VARSRVPPLSDTKWDGSSSYSLDEVVSHGGENWVNIQEIKEPPQWVGKNTYKEDDRVSNGGKYYVNIQEIKAPPEDSPDANANTEPGTGDDWADYWMEGLDTEPGTDSGAAYWRRQRTAWDDGTVLWDKEDEEDYRKIVAFTNVQAVQRLIQQEIPGSGAIQDVAAIAQFLRDAKSRIEGTLHKRYTLRQITEEEDAREILGPISASYAADQVFLSQRERQESVVVFTRWREDLKAVASGDIDLLPNDDDNDDESFIGNMGGRTYRG